MAFQMSSRWKLAKAWSMRLCYIVEEELSIISGFETMVCPGAPDAVLSQERIGQFPMKDRCIDKGRQ